ncbi:MAG: T9SS type A sorting domain-containing protein [Chitinophagaceae bacterium]|jgi:hypothetical protein
MKIIYLGSILVLLLFFTHTTFAQSWQWGLFAGTGSGGTNSTYDLQSDPNGNTYLLCNANGLFLTSHDGDGKPRWNKTIKGASVVGRNVRISPQGNVYALVDVEISHDSTALFDADTSVPYTRQSQKMTLICYDTTGKFKWLVRPDTNLLSLDISHTMYSMDIDEDGNVYCLVNMPAGNPILGSALTIPSSPPPFGRGYYVLKYSPAGVLLSVTTMNDICRKSVSFSYWYNEETQISYNKFNKGFYISLPASYGDSIYVKGTIHNNTMFLGAFSKEGTLKWHRSDTSTASWGVYYSTTPIKIDNSGNIYWSGSTLNENRINGYDLKNVWCSDINKIAPFIIKMDSTGKLLWGMNGGSNPCYHSSIMGSNFALSGTGKEIGFITGYSMGKHYFGDPLKDTIQVNYSAFVTHQRDGWYAFIDLNIGKTNSIATIQGDSTFLGSTVRAHFVKNDLYVANYSNALNLLFDSSLLVKSTRTTAGHEVYLAKYGLPLGCTKAPSSSFTHLGGTFTFTGTTPNDSVTWDFGDGAIAKGSIITHKYALKGKYKVCAKVWTTDCGVLTSCMLVDIPVGIDEFSTSIKTVNIYPNPAHTTLTLVNTEAGDNIAIYNSIGQKMFRVKTSSDNELIKVEDWPAGVYFIKITNKNGISQQLSFSKY